MNFCSKNFEDVQPEYYKIYGHNLACLKCPNKETRANYAENGLCNQALSIHDGLPVRCVGFWATEKITRLVKYFQIFSSGMHNIWKINYIEICSGTGICINRKNGLEFDGTAISVLKNLGYKYLNKAIFIDNDPNVVEILNNRIANLEKENAIAVIGDYTDGRTISAIIARHINPRCLNLIFIDPTDCSVPFDTIRNIKESAGTFDLIINVATKTDFNRNIRNIIKYPNRYLDLKEKYILFLGSDIFGNQDFIDSTRVGSLDISRNIFRTEYQINLSRIGFNYFDIREVHGFYDLLFASGHERGLEFWNKANDIDPSGQQRMF